MMVECHAHIALDGLDYKAAVSKHKAAPDIDAIRNTLAYYQSKGITYIRDGGDRFGVSAAAALISREYGIEYRTPIFPIYKKGNYGSFIGRSYESIADYRELLREVKATGGDFIKLMLSGILDFDTPGALTGFFLPDEEVAELVRIAHGEGFAVMAHVNGAQAVYSAACAGVDSIEHGYYTDHNTRVCMAQANCIWVPTLAPFGDQLGRGNFSDDSLRQIMALQADALLDAAALNIPIAPGSDAGCAGVFHGDGIMHEEEYLRSIFGSETDNILTRGVVKIQRKFQRN